MVAAPLTSDRIRVLQMVDTLDAGGMERVAVNLANMLRRDRFESALCTTRRDGALAGLVAPDVARLRLNRSRTFDPIALARLGSFITVNGIHILHAHGSSLFTALAGSLFPPYPAVVWHDHYGPRNVQKTMSIYRLASRRVAAVLSVNQELAAWARRALAVRPDRVWYLPNYSPEPSTPVATPDLPGRAGARVVCVANVRPLKNQDDLVRAFALVRDQVPDAMLLLVGSTGDEPYVRTVRSTIADLRLDRHVVLLGQREDVGAILGQCDIGVLSSVAEGFPLALLEYGMAGVAVVASAVGQCPEILDGGKAGLLTRPRDPHQLADAIVSLLQSPSLRARLSQRLKTHVKRHYSQGTVSERLYEVYEAIAPASLRTAVPERTGSLARSPLS